MTILIFLIILGILVFVHELGHFLVGKYAGVKIQEFGFGYPPRALLLGKKWGTLFTLNWIPFGGFVKIFGEDYEENDAEIANETTEKIPEARYAQHLGSVRNYSQSSAEGDKNFTQISKKWQAAILFAGVLFNIIFAWFLFSVGFMIGLPTPVDNTFGGTVKNPSLTITEILADSPAQKAGLKTGDKIKEVSILNGKVLNELKPETVSDFINNSSGSIDLRIDRGGQILNFEITPKTGLVPSKKIIGISMDMIGTLSLPIHKAIYEGSKTTLELSYLTVKSIAVLIGQASRGKANISEVSGPVGIIGLVGDASRLGFAYLITFTALISINLAIINLVPFPALDGGRIAVVAFEGLTKRKMNPRIIHIINNVGFALLIALMIFITYHDILKLF
jgi:regulator of sigma E protease